MLADTVLINLRWRHRVQRNWQLRKKHGLEDSLSFLRSTAFSKMLSYVESNSIKLENSHPQGIQLNIQWVKMSLGILKNLLIRVQEVWFSLVGLNTASCSRSNKLNSLGTVFTWQKLHSLEHALFQSEVHHHMSHTVTDFWFQREAECWSHCDTEAEKAALAKCILHCLVLYPIFQNSNRTICITDVKLPIKD